MSLFPVSRRRFALFAASLVSALGITTSAFALDPPIAVPFTYTICFPNQTYTLPLIIGGGPADVTFVGVHPKYGSVMFGTGVGISYTVGALSGGNPDSMTYTAKNAAGTSAPALITILFTPHGPNQPCDQL